MRLTYPTRERAQHVASNLRQEDLFEAWCAYGLSGEEALMASWESSPICRCLMADDDEPVGLCGLDGTTVWFIGTEKVYSTARHRRQFAKMSKAWVESLIEIGARRLENRVLLHESLDNRERFRWLSYLGFTIDDCISDPRIEPVTHAFRHYWREA